jgi:capsular polysaccharide export protein
MEDGFLRSVRLGSELSAPFSLVLDERGIYYDPCRPSGLEEILQNADFSLRELERAAELRQRIVAAKISKYNGAATKTLSIAPRSGQRVILVPGQVEDDASVLLGSAEVRDNGALLEYVRADNPDAYIMYKPHPDVVAGNRKGHIQHAETWCDYVALGADVTECLALAQEVHTLTSLVGFEGLLRARRVVTYGQPFYAGWGLTEDRHPPARRSRKLGLDELVAGSLIRYPIYYSWRARAFTTPERAIDELLLERSASGTRLPLKSPWPVRQLRRLVWLARELAHAA